MQDVEKNMDDLFRKAVDNYTLQPGESNWETIVSQLSDDDDRAVIPVSINHKNTTAKNAISLLVLLLIPLSTAMYSLFYNGSSSKEWGEGTTISPGISQPGVNSTPVESKQNKAAFSKAKSKNTTTVQAPVYATLTTKNIQQSSTPATPIKRTEGINETQLVDSTYAASQIDNPQTARIGIEMNTTTQQQSSDNEQQPITPKRKSLQQHRLYAGLMAGVAFNEVKNQGFKKPGFDVGIIAGYRISKGISLEAGLVYSKKYYFSDGKYFSMDKMSGSVPTEMKILSLEGNSSVYQIPVAIRYNIVYKKEATIFASAGISSYILTKEKNDYQTSMNGVQQPMIGMYKKVSAGFASSFDVSIGYEHELQKTAIIRIQPYLQIPLKGMGMGSMQVMSTGIRIAYTR